MRIGTSRSSEKVMARCVASRSTGMGRDAAWYFGAVRLAAVSFSVSHAIASEFSACTMTIAPSRRAQSNTDRISRSESLRSS